MEILPVLLLVQTQSAADIKRSSDLDADQVSQVRSLLQLSDTIFSDLPGKTDLVKCSLSLTFDKPVHVPQYPIPLSVLETI